jgi:hypothetical protein
LRLETQVITGAGAGCVAWTFSLVDRMADIDPSGEETGRTRNV